MSDHTARGPDRRHQDGRREVDRNTHLLEQAVLSAAVQFVELDGDASADERIRLHRQLRERVRSYLEFAETGATTVEWLCMGVIAAAVVVPSALLGFGTWGRWLAVMAGLVACVVLLWRGERGRQR